jgi:glycerol-3-phosphate dehydrogenase
MATGMRSLSTQLLVIGGGATGLGIAWDACLRGIKTVLVERGDIGEGTSGRYHGLLHSGGRYVLSDPQSAAECATENQVLRNIAGPAIEETGGYFVSTPTDPLEYPDTWKEACLKAGVPCEEISSALLRKREPHLNPRISRAFEVQDASLDSFDLAHLLMNAIQQAGGKVLLRHAVTDLNIVRDQLQSVDILDLRENSKLTIAADFVINAAGPWAGEIANLAELQIPLTLSKGTMLAMASRLSNSVINRCKPPADGDIIVPVGAVCVLGTTDVRVDTPEDIRIEPWELDVLLSEADILIPGIIHHRPLRAWAGIRPLYAAETSKSVNHRSATRAHTIIDHRERDGIHNLFSVIGGKLTTYRLMAEEAVELVATRLGNSTPSSTMTTPLPSPERNIVFYLTDRLDRVSDSHPSENDMLICECELVTMQNLEDALLSDDSLHLDDIRRDLRLGMGPCQAAYCAFRAAGYADARKKTPPGFLSDFIVERWKGIQPLAWGTSLRQIEFIRRINLELLHVPMDKQ